MTKTDIIAARRQIVADYRGAFLAADRILEAQLETALTRFDKQNLIGRGDYDRIVSACRSVAPTPTDALPCL